MVLPETPTRHESPRQPAHVSLGLPDLRGFSGGQNSRQRLDMQTWPTLPATASPDGSDARLEDYEARMAAVPQTVRENPDQLLQFKQDIDGVMQLYHESCRRLLDLEAEVKELRGGQLPNLGEEHQENTADINVQRKSIKDKMAQVDKRLKTSKLNSEIDADYIQALEARLFTLEKREKLHQKQLQDLSYDMSRAKKFTGISDGTITQSQSLGERLKRLEQNPPGPSDPSVSDLKPLVKQIIPSIIDERLARVEASGKNNAKALAELKSQVLEEMKKAIDKRIEEITTDLVGPKSQTLEEVNEKVEFIGQSFGERLSQVDEAIMDHEFRLKQAEQNPASQIELRRRIDRLEERLPQAGISGPSLPKKRRADIDGLDTPQKRLKVMEETPANRSVIVESNNKYIGLDAYGNFIQLVNRLDFRDASHFTTLQAILKGPQILEIPLFTQTRDKITLRSFLRIGEGVGSTGLICVKPKDAGSLGQSRQDEDRVRPYGVLQVNGALNMSQYLVPLGEIWTRRTAQHQSRKSTSMVTHNCQCQAPKTESTNWFVMMDVEQPKKSLWMVQRKEWSRPDRKSNQRRHCVADIGAFDGVLTGVVKMKLLDDLSMWESPTEDMVDSRTWEELVLEPGTLHEEELDGASNLTFGVASTERDG